MTVATCHQAQRIEQPTQPAAGLPRSTTTKLPALEAFQILEEVRNSLHRDPAAARAGVDRLAEFLKVATGDEATLPVRGGLMLWQRRKVEAHIEERLGAPISIDALARHISLSAGHFRRAFKETFGTSPHAHIVRRRIARAQEVMLASSEPLSRIALTCGFADQAHFANVFRRLIGATPRDWRRANAVPAGES